MRTSFLVCLLLLAVSSAKLQAHVGSPDVYVDGQAGPYRLFVTVRPPTVIPGVAELEIRSATAGIGEIRAVPLPLTGPGATLAPVADTLKRSPQDPQFFTGSLWMMAPGSWQVKITADGTAGSGVVSIPIPSAALSTKQMQKGLAGILSFLMTFLVLGAVAIVGASVREAKLPAGVVPDQNHSRRARIAMAFAFVLVIAALLYGRFWWNAEASNYARNVYKPLTMIPQVNAGTLTLTLRDPGWLDYGSRAFRALPVVRTVDDLVPDHDHLMHLYVIRQPDLDIVYHLHPELVRPGVFELKLPSLPAGDYKLYADIVHQSGFPETLVTAVALPQIQGRELTGDDAFGKASGWSQSRPGVDEFKLPDGYRMHWLHVAGPLRSKQAQFFKFALLDPNGGVPADMKLYMGMLGHAAFLKTDGTVFAHIHPTGSISMAAYMKAQAQAAGPATGDMNMPGMDHSSGSMRTVLPNEVSFPFGLPSAGRYRVFVQMKHGSTVETGIFDATAE